MKLMFNVVFGFEILASSNFCFARSQRHCKMNHSLGVKPGTGASLSALPRDTSGLRDVESGEITTYITT